MTEPTMADVLGAVQGFGETYHDVLKTLDTVLTRIDAHDVESKRERAQAREQLVKIREQVESLQGQVDRRFDITFKEIDHVHRAVITLQVDVTELRTQATTRLADHDARLDALEARDKLYAELANDLRNAEARLKVLEDERLERLTTLAERFAGVDDQERPS